jgi:hypothetical protein
MVGNKPQSLSVLQIQAHKVGGSKRNSLPARTRKYRFSTLAIEEGDVREPILTQLRNLHEKEVAVRMACGFIVEGEAPGIIGIMALARKAEPREALF